MELSLQKGLLALLGPRWTKFLLSPPPPPLFPAPSPFRAFLLLLLRFALLLPQGCRVRRPGWRGSQVCHSRGGGFPRLLVLQRKTQPKHQSTHTARERKNRKAFLGGAELSEPWSLAWPVPQWLEIQGNYAINLPVFPFQSIASGIPELLHLRQG